MKIFQNVTLTLCCSALLGTMVLAGYSSVVYAVTAKEMQIKEKKRRGIYEEEYIVPPRVEGKIPFFEGYTDPAIKEYSRRSFKPKAYVPITMDNFINMYWGMGINSLDNAEAVDGYMMASECSIYKKHYHNEFEWHNIRSIARDIIQMNTKDFHVRYEFTQPLIFTNYDLRRKGFNVSSDTAYKGSLRLEIAADTTDKSCIYMGEGRHRVVPYHPRRIGVTVNHPINITFVSVPPDLAKEYIKIYEQKAIAENKPIVRNAYIRFKILVTNFKEIENFGQAHAERALFFGYIENYEIFADPDLRVSLYKSQTYKGHLDKIKHMNR